MYLNPLLVCLSTMYIPLLVGCWLYFGSSVLLNTCKNCVGLKMCYQKHTIHVVHNGLFSPAQHVGNQPFSGDAVTGLPSDTCLTTSTGISTGDKTLGMCMVIKYM